MEIYRFTGLDSQLRLNINYLNNDQKQKLKERSAYYFAATNTNLLIEESNVLDRYTNQGDAELTYTHNSSKQYMNDALKFSGVWNVSQSSVSGSMDVRQKFYTPLFYVQNDWNMIKKMQSRIFQFSSFIRYASLPQQLEIKTDSLTGEILQDVKLGNFYTNNSTAYGFLWKRSSLRFDFNLQAFLDDLNSSVNDAPLLFETDNHVKSNKWIYKITPKYNYHTPDSRFNFELLAPISLHTLSVNNLISKSKQNFTFLFANPSVSLNYKWSHFWNSDLSYRYTNDMGDIMNFTDAYILTNYRSFQRGSGILSRQTVQSGSVKVNYRNQIEALFFADLGIVHKTKKIEYSLDWTNIFNQRSYSYILYDGPNIFSHHFDLRPMNFLVNIAFKF